MVLIVDCARGHERTGVAKITAELRPLDLFSAFGQVGFVTREAANEASHDALGFLLRFSSCALRCFPCFALGHRIIPERGRWSLASRVGIRDAYR